MSRIGLDPAITRTLAAEQQANNQQIAFAVAAKQLESQRAAGDALNDLVRDAAQIQPDTTAQAERQIAEGGIDVRV